MRRGYKIVLLAALAALASFAAAQVQNEEGADSLLASSGRTILSVPATTPGPLIEDTTETVLHWWAEANMLRFSDSLSVSSAWIPVGFGAVTPGQADPFGGTGAFALVEDGTSAGHNIRSANYTRFGAAGTFTSSVYVKPVGRSYAYIITDAAGTCYFNLTGAGSLWGCLGGTNPAAISAVGNGFYRISVTETSINQRMFYLGAWRGTGPPVYAGTPGLTALIVYGPQVVRSPAAQPYQSRPTANLLASPSAFDASAWPKYGLGVAAPAVTPNVALAPDGTMTADQIAFPAVVGAGSVGIIYQSATAAAVPYTFSVWLRTASGTGVLYASFTNNSGTALTTPCAVTTTWSQCVFTQTLSAGTWFWYLGPDTRTASPISPQPVSQPALTVYAWGAALTRSDIDGDTLAFTGAPPAVTTSPLFPAGSGAGRRFVGPFSASNYFRWQSATPMQFTGDHTICVAYVRNSATSNFLHMIDAGALTGWYFQDTAGTVSYREISNSVDKGAAISVATTPGALNVLCGGRSGTTIYAKLNGGTTAATPNAAVPLSYPTDMYIGEWSGVVPLLGSVYEVWATTTAWSEGNVANIEAAALANGGKGPIFPDDAGTVLHLVGNAYDGSTWKAPQATLTTAGAVPYSDTWVPPVAGQLQRQGIGPFGTFAYLGLGTGLDVLDFTGDWSGCIVYMPSSLAGAPGILSNGNTVDAGYGLWSDTGGATSIRTWWGGGGTSLATVASATVAGALNVACFGRGAGLTQIKVNLSATVTAAAASTAAATATAVKLGLDPWGTPMSGTIYEAWFSTEPASDALFTKIQQRVFQHLSAHDSPITTTRTSGATFELPSGAVSTKTVFTAPGNITVAQPDGSEVWRASTNLVLNSAAFDQASWTKTGTAGQEAQVTATDSAIAPDGTQTADTIYLTTITAEQASHVYAYVNGGAVLPVVPHTSTLWLKGVSESNTAYLRAWIAATGASIAFTPCAYTTTAWTKCTLTWTPHAASTESIIAIGQVGSENGAQNAKTFYAWGAQTEAQPYATPYIPTAGTTAARNASAISIPNPLPANSASWCLRFTARPGVSRTWADGETHTFLSSGADGSANSFSVTQDPTNSLVFTVYDSAATAKWFSTPGFTDSSAHDVAVCLRQATPYVYIDGFRSTGVAGGLGTGVIATPQSTIYLGSLNGTTNFLDGVIRDVQFCDGPTGACTQNAAPSASNATTYYPWTQSGSFITDANTLANVTFNGSAIVDPYNVWTMAGTVSQNTATPFYRQGFSGAQVKGAGPYTDANYYALTGDLGPITQMNGAWSACIAEQTTGSLSGGKFLAAAGLPDVDGWYLRDDGVNRGFYGFGGTPSNVSVTSTGTGPVNVTCFGMTANNTPVIKHNMGTYTAAAAPGVLIAASTTPRIMIGRRPSAGVSWPGNIIALWISTTVPSDTLFKKQIQSFLGSIGTTASEVLTTTRTTSATGITPDGTSVFTWPPGVPRVACDGTAGKCGLQVEPARTNYGLYSGGRWVTGTVPSGWTSCGSACANDAAVDPSGTSSAVRLTLASPAEVFNNVSIGTDINNRTFTGSVFCRSVSGTAGAIYLGMTDTGSWAVGRAGQARCALLAGGNYTRCMNTVTYTASPGATAIGFVIGTTDHRTGLTAPAITVDCWGYQVEEGAYATSYISTQGSAGVRNADVITTPNYIWVTSNFCVDGVYTPEGLHPWVEPTGVTGYLWVAGSGLGPNTYKIYGDTALHAEVRDDLVRQLDVVLPATFTAGSSHQVSFDYSPTGLNAYTLRLDGGYNYGTLSGTGTGITVSQPATITLGANSVTGSEWGGFIRHYRLCNTACRTCR